MQLIGMMADKEGNGRRLFGLTKLYLMFGRMAESGLHGG